MLRDSIAYAREDEAARALREQQLEADRLIVAVAAALAADAEALLKPEERAAIETRLEALKQVRVSADILALRQAIAALDQATQDFAHRRMDAGIRAALAGHKLDELPRSPESDKKA